MLITSSVKGNGYGSFLVATLSFLKSTQILSFPFFLSIITTGDSQVASSIGVIKHVASNLIISCLIMATQYGYGSLLVATLSFLKSTQILNFPFFLSTITTGDSQVASSISVIKHVASNLVISCLTSILLDEQVVSMCPTQSDVELHHVVFPSNLCKSGQKFP